jgi:hypothetical protein
MAAAAADVTIEIKEDEMTAEMRALRRRVEGLEAMLGQVMGDLTLRRQVDAIYLGRRTHEYRLKTSAEDVVHLHSLGITTEHFPSGFKCDAMLSAVYTDNVAAADLLFPISHDVITACLDPLVYGLCIMLAEFDGCCNTRMSTLLIVVRWIDSFGPHPLGGDMEKMKRLVWAFARRAAYSENHSGNMGTHMTDEGMRSEISDTLIQILDHWP